MSLPGHTLRLLFHRRVRRPLADLSEVLLLLELSAPRLSTGRVSLTTPDIRLPK